MTRIILCIKSIYLAFFVFCLSVSGSAQHSLLENPFQLDWLNQRIDATSSTDERVVNFDIGLSAGDTLIQISEKEDGDLVKVETFDSDGGLVQLCQEGNGVLTCFPSGNQIELNEVRTIWATGNSMPCSQRDSFELTRFYWTLNGPEWDDQWDFTQPMSTWDNIHFDPDGCVRYLYSDINAEGYLQDYHFPEIRRISFGILNELYGELLDFQHMPKLEVLSILGKSLNGEIPNFSHFPELYLLTLNQSEFTGSIPNFDKLPKLTSIDLSKNNLTGEIPEFDHCLELERANFAMNDLEGEIPSFENHPELFQLNLWSCNLSGEIPEFNNNPKLNYLSLHNNNLTGSIPNFSNCPLLKTISLSGNLLTGSIPDFEMCQQLEILKVSDNLLTGAIPSFESIPLEQFICYDNNIDELVPNFSESCPSLFLCNVRRNSLTFEDILPTYVANDTSCVSPFPQLVQGGYFFDSQNRIYQDTIFTIEIGGSLIIDLEIDEMISDNVYHWMKDDSFYREVIGVNKLEFLDIQESDTGIYTVEITNPQALDLTLLSYDIEIKVGEISSVVDVSTSLFELYPNPVSNILTVEYASGFSIDDVVQVYDSNGVLIKENLILSGSQSVQFDCSEFSAGLYMIQIKSVDSAKRGVLVKL